MVDYDVVQTVAKMWGVAVVRDRYNKALSHHQTPYSARARGKRAVVVMWLLRPYMHSRRQARIDEVLATAEFFKSGPGPRRLDCRAVDLRPLAESLVLRD
jgi:hypothetical protein